MRINTYPVIRKFDSRRVWYWGLFDKQHKLLDCGCGLTEENALRQARAAYDVHDSILNKNENV